MGGWDNRSEIKGGEGHGGSGKTNLFLFFLAPDPQIVDIFLKKKKEEKKTTFSFQMEQNPFSSFSWGMPNMLSFCVAVF